MTLWPPDRPVLVTGASGFLGEHLCRHLLAGGVSVVGTYLSRPVTLPRADAIPLDLADAAAVRRLFRDLRPAAVAHCAAMAGTTECERNPEAARAAILDATTHLAAAAAEFTPLAPVLSVSTDLVFDGTAAPYAPGDAAKPVLVYGSLKWAAERPVRALAHGIVARAALMYGNPMTFKSGFLGWMREALAAGRPLELFEDEFRCPLWVEDMCVAVTSLLAQGRPGLWHAGGPERLSRFEIGRQVCQVFGFEEGLLVARRLAESPAPTPRPPDVAMDSSALWTAIGRQPVDLTTGLRIVREREERSQAP